MFRSFRRFIFQIGLILVFTLVVTGVILSAYGYQLDFRHYSLIKTSIIHLADRIPKAMIYLDGVLMAQSLPEKLFDVPLGYHELVVEKSDYRQWRRRILVEPDLVTKINGVALVPTVLFPQRLAHADLSFFSPNKEKLLLIDQKIQTIRLISNLSGTYLYDFFETGGKKVQTAEWLDNNRFLVFFEGNMATLFRSTGLEPLDTWALPADFTKIWFNENRGYALFNNDLVSFPFSKNIEPMVILNSVKFFKGSQGLLYAITLDGTIWQIDLGSLEKVALGHHIVDDFEVTYGQGYALILFVSGDLLSVSLDEPKLTLIDTAVTNVSEISAEKQILYTRGYEINAYDLGKRQNRLVTRFAEAVKSLSWHDSFENFFFTKGQALFICDYFGSNCHELAENIVNDLKPVYLPETKNIFFKNKEAVYSLSIQ